MTFAEARKAYSRAFYSCMYYASTPSGKYNRQHALDLSEEADRCWKELNKFLQESERQPVRAGQ